MGRLFTALQTLVVMVCGVRSQIRNKLEGVYKKDVVYLTPKQNDQHIKDVIYPYFDDEWPKFVDVVTRGVSGGCLNLDNKDTKVLFYFDKGHYEEAEDYQGYFYFLEGRFTINKIILKGRTFEEAEAVEIIRFKSPESCKRYFIIPAFVQKYRHKNEHVYCLTEQNEVKKASTIESSPKDNTLSYEKSIFSIGNQYIENGKIIEAPRSVESSENITWYTYQQYNTSSYKPTSPLILFVSMKKENFTSSKETLLDLSTRAETFDENTCISEFIIDSNQVDPKGRHFIAIIVTYKKEYSSPRLTVCIFDNEKLTIDSCEVLQYSLTVQDIQVLVCNVGY